jgi:hypothetical protein
LGLSPGPLHRLENQKTAPRGAPILAANLTWEFHMFPFSRSTIAIAVLSAVLVGTVAVENHRIRTLQEHSGQLALRNDSAAAAADTTRNVALEKPGIAKILGDSLKMAQHRVIQVTQNRDSIDRILGLEREAKYSLSAQLDSLQRVVAATSATTEDSATRVRRATFDVRQAPYTLVANVELPAPPDTGKLDVTVALDPIPLVARLSCAAPNADGIRSASIETTSPAWAKVNFTDVQQSPDLCRSPALEGGGGWHMHPAFVVGGGLIAPSTRKVQLGGFAGVALAYGR